MNATFTTLTAIIKLDPAERQKLTKSLTRKTEAEQLIIYDIKTKIYSKVRTDDKRQDELLKALRRESPARYDYYITLLAIQLYTVNSTKSQYIARIREARQQPSPKTNTLAQAVKVLLPLIDELREAGATWEQVAKTLSTKQKKILGYRTITTDYLKKTYGRIKTRS